jgi:hypothetical protein
MRFVAFLTAGSQTPDLQNDPVTLATVLSKLNVTLGSLGNIIQIIKRRHL